MFNLFRDQKGSQAIEFVAVIPLFIVMMLLIWQFGLVTYTMVVAQSAAHDGARAVAAGNNGNLAAQKTAYGFSINTQERKSAKEITFIVNLDVPMIKLPLLEGQKITMTGRATMPLEKSL